MRIIRLKQGTKSIKEDIKEFIKVTIHNKVIKMEARKADRYHKELRFNIQRKMIAARTWTLEETYQLKLKVEENLKAKSDRQFGSQDGSI